MKLAIVTHNVLRGDGQGRVLYELTSEALRRGCEVMLVADRVEEAIIAAGAQWTPVHPIIRRPLLPKVWDFARRADRIVPALRDQGYLVVGNGYTLTEAHHVNISHFVHGAQSAVGGGSASGSKLRRWYRAIYHRFNARQEKKAYGSASAVVAISHAVERELAGIGVPGDQIRVIHHGVDTDEFHPGPQDPVALGLPATGPRALFVGDIRSGRKNLEAVLRALRSAQQVRLIVVGQLEGSPYPAMARQLGVSERVTFLGFRSDVASIMRACDFMVFPTRYEPFGLVVLEALSSGLPVIVTRAAGAAEIMSPQCGVLLDDPDQIEPLAKAMHELSDSHFRESAAKAARDVACQHDWRRMSAQYMDLFAEVIAGPAWSVEASSKVTPS